MITVILFGAGLAQTVLFGAGLAQTVLFGAGLAQTVLPFQTFIKLRNKRAIHEYFNNNNNTVVNASL